MSLEMGELYRLDSVEVARMRANNKASFASHTHAEYVVSANLRGSERIRIDGKEINASARMVTVYNPEAVQRQHSMLTQTTLSLSRSTSIPLRLFESDKPTTG